VNGPGSSDRARQQGIAAAITEVSERASVLIHEEIELAKTEVTEKVTRLAKGAVVALVAGIFFLTALFFVLIGLAWLLYYELPIGNEFTYFWGFFAMAVILVVLGALAGWLAAKAVKSGSPPVPAMAIEEARKIRETVSSKPDGSTVKASAAGAAAASAANVAGAAPTPTSAGSEPPVPPPAAAEVAPQTQSPVPKQDTAQSQPSGNDPDSELGRGAIDGTTLGR
jgi:uncharacterized membrane protein YqjE